MSLISKNVSVKNTNVKSQKDFWFTLDSYNFDTGKCVWTDRGDMQMDKLQSIVCLDEE